MNVEIKIRDINRSSPLYRLEIKCSWKGAIETTLLSHKPVLHSLIPISVRVYYQYVTNLYLNIYNGIIFPS